MSFKERVYSVLVVSAADNFNSALKDLLPESKYHPVHTVSNISTAKRIVAERVFDYVIVNSPLPDDNGTHFAVDVCAGKGTVVLLFVRNDVYAQVFNKVAEHGVFVLPKEQQYIFLHRHQPQNGFHCHQAEESLLLHSQKLFQQQFFLPC